MAEPNSESALERVAKLILGEDFYEVARFFLEINERCRELEESGELVIAAFVTRRCHVLSLIFRVIFSHYSKWPENLLPEYLGKGFSFERYADISDRCYTTDINLACLGRQIAEYYNINQRIPHIIVVDEMLLHGRTLNGILKNLEQSILSFVTFPIKKAGMDTAAQNLYVANYMQRQFSSDFIQDQFLANLEIRVYVQNDEPLLLLAQYQRQLWSSRICSPLQTRERSKQFSLLISVSQVNNNSCSWGIRRKNKLEPIGSIPDVERVDTSCSKIRQTTYLWAYPNKQRPTALLTFRTKHSYLTSEEDDNYWLGVPFVITARIPMLDLLEFCERLYDRDFPQELRSILERYLDKRVLLSNPRRKIYYRRLLEFSNLILCGLYTKKIFEKTIDHEALELDMLAESYANFTERFAGEKDIKPHIREELVGLWNFLMSQKAEQLENYLELLLKNAAPLWEMPNLSNDFKPIDERTCKQLQNYLELKIAKLGYRTEGNAYRHSNGSDTLWMGQSFWGTSFYLGDQLPELLDVCYNNLGQVYTLIAMLVQQMDLGVIGLNPTLYSSFDESASRAAPPSVALELRAGEQSLAIKPMLYQKYIPVLIRIKERCGDNWSAIAAELDRFCKNLKQVGKNVDAEKLIWDLFNFIYDLDSTGQQLEDWNFSFVDSIPKQEFGASEVGDSGGKALLKSMIEQRELLWIYNQI